MTINETCSGSSFLTSGNLFVFFLFSVTIAVIVVALTELLHSLRRGNSHPAPAPLNSTPVSPCVKCECRSLLEVNERDQREYKLEKGSFTRSDHSLRGKIWHQHPTWHIPTLEREQIQVFSGIDDVLKILDRFDVSPHR